MKDTVTNYEEETRILETIEAMKIEAGPAFSLATINLVLFTLLADYCPP